MNETRPLAGLRVVQFGGFDPEYARNRTIRKALMRAGADVAVISRQGNAYRRSASLARRLLRARCDLVLVGYPGHGDMPTAAAAARMKRIPVVFDALVSLYDSAVNDRATMAATSFRARRLLIEDRLAYRLADLMLIDTDAEIDFFVEQGAARERCRRVWVGADDEVVVPATPREARGVVTAVFYGTYIPLHGVEYVVRAAHELQQRRTPVEIVMIGDGQEKGATVRLARELGVNNVRFLDKLPYEALARHVAAADICLGIFGTTDKAKRVIPNKAFDALAAARPLITADTPAAREVFVHGEHVWLCRPGDPVALADALTALVESSEKRAELGCRGYVLFKERFGLDALARQMTEVLAPMVMSR